MPKTAIKAKKISARSRMRFLAKHFGNYFLHIESSIYSRADRFLKGYGEASGYWEYYETNKGHGFLVPAMPGPVTVENVENYRTEKMSPEAAGLTLTILALNYLAAKHNSQFLCDKWEALMDFARDHEESSAILSILD